MTSTNSILDDLAVMRAEITRLARENENLRHDDLTGLLRRGPWTPAAEARLRSLRGDAVLLVVDLDRFKQINDTWGHAAGDDVLRAQAQRVRRLLPAGLACRRGGDSGDELVVLAHSSEVGPGRVRRVRRALAAPVSAGGRLLPVSACVGVARAGGAVVGLATLLTVADRALYEAKTAGPGSAQEALISAISLSRS